MEDNEQITTLDGFDDAMSGLESDGTTPGTTPDETPATEEQSDVETDNDIIGGTEAEVPAAKNKANQAFAELRTQSKAQQQALERILVSAGMDPALARNPKAVMDMFDEADTADKAAQMNVPPELLSRLNQLEKTNKAQEDKRLYDNALNGFAAVQTKYGLSKTEVAAFAAQLQSDGINPFTGNVNIEREYKLANLDTIIERERKAAVQAVIDKQNKATTHSTKPATVQGKPAADDNGDKINTMAQFDMMLLQLGK